MPISFTLGFSGYSQPGKPAPRFGKSMPGNPRDGFTRPTRNDVINTLSSESIDGISFKQFIGVALRIQQTENILYGNFDSQDSRHHRWQSGIPRHRGKREIKRYLSQNPEPSRPGISIGKMAYELACSEGTSKKIIQQLSVLNRTQPFTERFMKTNGTDFSVNPQRLEDMGIDFGLWYLDAL